MVEAAESIASESVVSTVREEAHAVAIVVIRIQIMVSVIIQVCTVHQAEQVPPPLDQVLHMLSLI